MSVASCIQPPVLPQRMNRHTFNIAKQYAMWTGTAWVIHSPRPNFTSFCPADEQLTVAIQLHTWFEQVGLKCRGFVFRNKERHGKDELTVCGVTFA